MCVDFLIYAGKVLLMGTKKNWKNKKNDLYSFNHVGIYLFCQRFTGAGKPAHWLLGKLMATRKDAMS